MTVFVISPVEHVALPEAPAKFVIEVAQRIAGDTTYVKHMPASRIEAGADDHFIQRRVIPCVQHLKVVDGDGNPHSANLYAMRTQSKHRGVVYGIAVGVHHRGWYYDEEISEAAFNELINLTKEFASKQTIEGIDHWLGEPAYPAYVNAIADTASLR